MKRWLRAIRQAHQIRKMKRTTAGLAKAWREFEAMMKAAGHGSDLKVIRRDVINGRFKIEDWLTK